MLFSIQNNGLEIRQTGKRRTPFNTRSEGEHPVSKTGLQLMRSLFCPQATSASLIFRLHASSAHSLLFFIKSAHSPQMFPPISISLQRIFILNRICPACNVLISAQHTTCTPSRSKHAILFLHFLYTQPLIIRYESLLVSVYQNAKSLNFQTRLSFFTPPSIKCRFGPND